MSAATLAAAATALQHDHACGAWQPLPGECYLAAALARHHWTPQRFRIELEAAPTSVRQGRLAAPHALHALENPDIAQQVLVPLRQLVDALPGEP